MEKMYNFFLSRILYKKVYDEYNEVVGKLWDVYVTTEEGYPRAIGYKVKKDGEMFSYEFSKIDVLKEEGKYSIKVRGVKEIIPRKYSYLLSKHLLDRQIVDIDGKKIVRVNDLRMAEIAGELRVVAVDSGVLALGRRLGVENMVKEMYKMMKKHPGDSLITWDNVESLEMVNSNLKLSVSYNKLSKLHPADLADIIEDMDSRYRKLVFESLDHDLAADTLEEIEPEIQASLLETLSQDKAAEVLDSMPNDEIADMLDEVDEETAEKILLNMEKQDADEVRTLMEYEEETAGSIMNKDFISFNINITAQETIELLREIKPDDEVAYSIYITDENEKLHGVISLRDLVVASPERRLQDIMKTEVIKVKDSENIDEAIETAVKYNLLSLPVVNSDERLCGIIITSDIIDEILLPTWRKKNRKIS